MQLSPSDMLCTVCRVTPLRRYISTLTAALVPETCRHNTALELTFELFLWF